MGSCRTSLPSDSGWIEEYSTTAVDDNFVWIKGGELMNEQEVSFSQLKITIEASPLPHVYFVLLWWRKRRHDYYLDVTMLSLLPVVFLRRSK